jgi:LemA protein
MKKVLIALGVVLALILLIGGWFVSTGNQLVTLEEDVSGKWAQVENAYQRRQDLIPNLVATVKGYAKHEADVLIQVTQARASVGQIKVNQPGDLAKFDQAQGQISSALSRLMVVAEKYPELKANQNFLDLQSQLEGTENRITIERQRFNQSAQAFNTAIKMFPASVVAGMRGLQARPYFAADAGAKNAPKVEF